MKLLIIRLSILVSITVLLFSCGKQVDEMAQGWSTPIKVTESIDSLGGGVSLYRWRSTIIALQQQDGWSAKYFLLNRDSNSWSEVGLSGVPRGYRWDYPSIDPDGDGILFQQGYIENDHLVMDVFVGCTSGNVAVRDGVERKWIKDTKALFGETRSNVRLTEQNELGRRRWLPSLGLGIINGSNLYIPHCLEGFTFDEKGVALARGPYSSGVFHSTDSAKTWQVERISDSEAWLPSLCKTKDYYYYFAVKNFQRDLWFARKPIGGGSWDAPKVLTKTFCDSALYWKYVAMAENDTVHVCWLDRRHEKRRLNLFYAQRQNYEIAYCQRKDADTNWRNDVVLSKGLLYSYSPSMSVEGDKIVVTWSGVQTAPDGHNEFAPNDIYYVTSKDGGKTWSKLLKLTNGAKDGITTGQPQVALLNGVIHLFYIQGKMNLKELSPGLTKLNQPPWPIYYTQRPFPE